MQREHEKQIQRTLQQMVEKEKIIDQHDHYAKELSSKVDTLSSEILSVSRSNEELHKTISRNEEELRKSREQISVLVQEKAEQTLSLERYNSEYLSLVQRDCFFLTVVFVQPQRLLLRQKSALYYNAFRHMPVKQLKRILKFKD